MSNQQVDDLFNLEEAQRIGSNISGHEELPEFV
jgi:hypothetical protein